MITEQVCAAISAVGRSMRGSIPVAEGSVEDARFEMSEARDAEDRAEWAQIVRKEEKYLAALQEQAARPPPPPPKPEGYVYDRMEKRFYLRILKD